MSDQEIFKQLNRLKTIRPAVEYSGVSRLIITASRKAEPFVFSFEDDLKLPVAELETISPSPKFRAASRSAILNHPRTLAEKVMRVFSPQNVVRQLVGYSLSVGLAVALIAIVIGGTGSFKAIPEINGELASDAETSIKDIDIHLEEASYFALSADKTRTALNNVTGADTETTTPPKNPSNPRIIDMLKEATL